MNTKEFISVLRRSKNKYLIFLNNEGTSIHPGYHLTEVKAARFDTVDCGARKNNWNETIVQLWVPTDETDQTFMTAEKFLSIYDKVSRMVDVDSAAEIRFEYGDKNFFPSNYYVDSISETGESIQVKLRPPQTTCKARDRRRLSAACCN